MGNRLQLWLQNVVLEEAGASKEGSEVRVVHVGEIFMLGQRVEEISQGRGGGAGGRQ